REGEDEAGEDDRHHSGEAEREPPAGGPDQPGRPKQNGEHEVPAVDVRVPEERVDPEVEMEVVGGVQLAVPEEVVIRVLAYPDGGQDQALRENQHESPLEQAAVPGLLRQQGEEGGERNQEEAHVARGEGDVLRVDG